MRVKIVNILGEKFWVKINYNSVIIVHIMGESYNIINIMGESTTFVYKSPKSVYKFCK